MTRNDDPIGAPALVQPDRRPSADAPRLVWARIAGARRAALEGALDLGAPVSPPERKPVVAFAWEARAEGATHAPEVVLAVPVLARSLRVSAALRRLRVPAAVRRLLPEAADRALVWPFSSRKPAVREIDSRDPRMTRLWERFSVDVGVALERDASFIAERVFSRNPSESCRVLILEDGDRYAIRAMCAFTVRYDDDDHGGRTGYVMELLHDRSVAGMRAASHLLGLALREMVAVGADHARAVSLAHSGSFPIYAAHAFSPISADERADRRALVVRALDPAFADHVTQPSSWYVSYLDAPPDQRAR